MDDLAMQAVSAGDLGDPFAVLGRHDGELRVLAPGAHAVAAIGAEGQMLAELVQADGLFRAPLATDQYRLRIDWGNGAIQETEDPYSFGLLLGPLDLHLIAEGRHRELADALGAHRLRISGVDGVRFAVWAPNARRVSVVGDFNGWNGRRHPMRLRAEAGVWELFIPGLRAGALYKYEIVGRDGGVQPMKADPVGGHAELPPATASVVPDPTPFAWTDADWMAQRPARQGLGKPLAIYELHATSWIRVDGRVPDWDALADRLVPYVLDMGFSHIELLPVMAHPFGGSWGYQPLGLFAPIAELGPPAGFARFVDRCHAAGIGVILDWVPAHFPNDAHGLVRFDGTALYEHADPREGLHHDWNTLIYNFGRHEVRGFLIASALHWLRYFHADGLRVDAVASMLYRDYSRAAGEWVPNRLGGRENLEAVAFLRELSDALAEHAPGTLLIAEESTAWPGVSAPVAEGGLGFTHKWNMGWMHDTLLYFQHDPVHRRYHHDNITFGLVYAFSERFVLPLSHDEVVHGKASLLGRMPGDAWQRFSNLRACFGLMWAHPGGKLLFMGGEFAQAREWNHDFSLDWHLLDTQAHRGVQMLVRDLNLLHRALPALHARDNAPDGFRWVVGDDREQSVFAFLRFAPSAAPVLAVANLTPVPRRDYRIGVPQGGRWKEMLNSDAADYGGSGLGNGGLVQAEDRPSHGLNFSVRLTLPPLAVLLLSPDSQP